MYMNSTWIHTSTQTDGGGRAPCGPRLSVPRFVLPQPLSHPRSGTPPQLQLPRPPLLPPSADQRHVQIEVSRPCTQPALSGGTGASGDTSPPLVLPAVAGAWGRRRVGGTRGPPGALLQGHAGGRDEDPLPSSPGGPSSPSSPGDPPPTACAGKGLRMADVQTRSSNSAGVGSWRLAGVAVSVGRGLLAPAWSAAPAQSRLRRARVALALSKIGPAAAGAGWGEIHATRRLPRAPAAPI